MKSKLSSHFPVGFTPNESQVKILNQLDDALEASKKFIIINAPTATGKSFIAKTLANYSKEISEEFKEYCYSYALYDVKKKMPSHLMKPMGCAILTVSKNLQNQYLNTFPDSSMLKGQGSYPCPLTEIFDCDNGLCKFRSGQRSICMSKDQCPYFNAKNNALSNKCAVYNYSMFDCLEDEAKHKDIIVCDECSELESELVKMHTYTITYKDVAKMNTSGTIIPDAFANSDVWYSWLSELLYDVTKLYEKQVKRVSNKEKKKKKLSKDDVSKLNFYKSHKDDLTAIVETWHLSEYIVSKKQNYISFQPYNIDGIAKDRLFDFGNTIVLMSATIVDYKKFAETFGITDYAYIEVESPLAPEKAPIYFDRQYCLNYKNTEYCINQMANLIASICEKHKDKKGIIHTHSMSVLRCLQNIFGNNDRFLWREDGVTNEMIMETHANSDEPTILVSPSMTHGIDLKGKLGEFQIIMKAPYLPLSDDRIKRKFNEDIVWYTQSMLSTFIQECGRCNRCEEDYSETYVLDGNICRSVIDNMSLFTDYFKKRCKKFQKNY